VTLDCREYQMRVLGYLRITPAIEGRRLEREQVSGPFPESTFQSRRTLCPSVRIGRHEEFGVEESFSRNYGAASDS
jgi:hypothetical protein